jgi:hypothetical protein
MKVLVILLFIGGAITLRNMKEEQLAAPMPVTAPAAAHSLQQRGFFGVIKKAVIKKIFKIWKIGQRQATTKLPDKYNEWLNYPVLLNDQDSDEPNENVVFSLGNGNIYTPKHEKTTSQMNFGPKPFQIFIMANWELAKGDSWSVVDAKGNVIQLETSKQSNQRDLSFNEPNGFVNATSVLICGDNKGGNITLDFVFRTPNLQLFRKGLMIHQVYTRLAILEPLTCV